MIKKRSFTDIVQSAIRKLSNDTNINFFGQGSVARSLIEAIAREIESVYDSIDVNLSQSRLSSASGAFLDIIGSQFGLSRLSGGSGTILAQDRAMRFFTNTGRLIDHLPLNSSSGRIPANTTISNKSGTVQYIVTEDVIFPANATSVFVPIAPSNESAGNLNNVGVGSLVVHNLPSQKVLCENVSPIVVSSDSETDDEFRLRISRQVNGKVTGGKSAIVQAAFSFPGVSDIKVYPFKFGAGSFEILVVPTASRISQNILSNIKSSIDAIVPYGIRAEVRGPDIVKFSIVGQVITDKGINSAEKSAAISIAKNNLKSYIGNIRMGGEFILNRAISTIIDSHPAIKDVKIMQLNINCKPQVISNYQLREDEVFDLDDKIANPLLIV